MKVLTKVSRLDVTLLSCHCVEVRIPELGLDTDDVKYIIPIAVYAAVVSLLIIILSITEAL